MATREYRRKGENRTVILTADPPILELANESIFFQESDSANRIHDFQLIGADTSEHLAQILNAINDTSAFTWTAGTIDVDVENDVVYSWDTPLAALRKLAIVAELEINIRRDGATGYFIDLLTAIGSAEAQVELRTSANLPELNRRELPEEQATIVLPRGQNIAGTHGRIASAQWAHVTAGPVGGTTLDLGGQFTGAGTPTQPGPIQFDDQYVGAAEGGHGPSMYCMFVHEVSGVRTWIGPITGTTVANQRVTMVSTGTFPTSTNSRIMITPGNSDGREGLFEVVNTGGVATYGPIRKILDLPQIPGYQNLIPFSSFSRFVSGVTATGFAVGGAVFADNTDQTFIRHGTRSLRVTCTDDGDGFSTPFWPIDPTDWRGGVDAAVLENLFSGYFIFWNDNAGTGRVRVEFDLGYQTGGPSAPELQEFYTFPAGTSDDTKAFSTKSQQWVSLGVAGMDKAKTLFTDQTQDINLVRMRCVQDGSTAVIMYLDAVMLTRSTVQIPYVETNGGNMMIAEANKYLAAHATPDVEYSLRALDLERIDRTVWPGYEFALGQTARVVDVPAGISDTVRLVSLGRDWLKAGRTTLQLNTQPRTLASSVARFFKPQTPRIVETDERSQLALAQLGGTGATTAAAGSSYALDGWEVTTVTQNIAKATATILDRHTDDAFLTAHPSNVTALVVRVPSNATLTVGTITISVVKGVNAGATADATVDTVLEVAIDSTNIADAAADGGVVATALPAAFQLPVGHDIVVAYSTTATITGTNLELRASIEVSRGAAIPTILEGPGPSGRMENITQSQIVTGTGTSRDESNTPGTISADTDPLISVTGWFKRSGTGDANYNLLFGDRQQRFIVAYNNGTTPSQGNHIEVRHLSAGGDDAIYTLEDVPNDGLNQWIGILVTWDRNDVSNTPVIRVIVPSISVDLFSSLVATEFQALTVAYGTTGFDGWCFGADNNSSQEFVGNMNNWSIWSGTILTEAQGLSALLVNAPLSSPAPDAHYPIESDLRDDSGDDHDVFLAVSAETTTYDDIGPPYQ